MGALLGLAETGVFHLARWSGAAFREVKIWKTLHWWKKCQETPLDKCEEVEEIGLF